MADPRGAGELSILVVSVSHKTAPVEVLAHLTLDAAGTVKLGDA